MYNIETPPLAGYRKSAMKFNSSAKLQLFFKSTKFFFEKKLKIGGF